MWSDGGGTASPRRTFIETARRAQIVAAAVETIAEVGYERASLARIAARLGISKGVISYHFAGKDDLIRQVVREVVEQARAYMIPRITAESTGTAMLRVYIESNLAFMRDHRNQLVAVVEIARNTWRRDERPRLLGEGLDADTAVRLLAQLLGRFQATGEFRRDFDPRAMAIAIRAAIDAVPPRLSFDTPFDIDSYAHETATLFDLATRA
jgi:AcrR family transcriptional regulator